MAITGHTIMDTAAHGTGITTFTTDTGKGVLASWILKLPNHSFGYDCSWMRMILQ
jgi:hypothetical protein